MNIPICAPIDAINFGGGTPTALLPEQMDAVLTELRNCFDIAPEAEISVESSATELTAEMLEVLKEGRFLADVAAASMRRTA